MKDNPQTKLQPLSDEHKEVCGCGHDHNHEEHTESHKESCSCGHDHSDEESCGCGHDHGHEESCGCGHDHNHEEHTESHKENCSCGHDHGHAHAQKSHTHAFSQETSKASAGKTVFILENLGCAHCASKMEEKIGRLPGVEEAVIIFATKQLRLSAENPQELLPEIQRICTSIESQVRVVPGKGTGQKAEEAQMPAMSHKEAKEEEACKKAGAFGDLNRGGPLSCRDNHEVSGHSGNGLPGGFAGGVCASGGKGAAGGGQKYFPRPDF